MDAVSFCRSMEMFMIAAEEHSEILWRMALSERYKYMPNHLNVINIDFDSRHRIVSYNGNDQKNVQDREEQ